MTDRYDRYDLEVGDVTTLVITNTNRGEDRDPMSQIDGVATFIRFEGDYQPEFGETVKVKIADISDRSIVAVALGRGDNE